MRSIAVVLLGLWLVAPGPAAEAGEWIDARTARTVAEARLGELGRAEGHEIRGVAIEVPGAESEPLARIFELAPTGFVIVSGHRNLPPVLAYSTTDPAALTEPERSLFLALLAGDLELRLAAVSALPAETVIRRHQEWDRLHNASDHTPTAPQQWPPPGTTSTGGWLEANWHQNHPYNASCPLDPVTSTRSVAGCPSVAMAMIIDFHHTTTSTQLSDVDDYFHNYAGRSYWIDDDWEALDFPSFKRLSDALDVLNGHYRDGLPADDADCAALTFACGVAARQVYTSSISGTFGVGQAYDAYQRFLIDGCELLGPAAPDIYPRLAQNMMEGLPAHLAVVNPQGTAGHNVVVDGYNTDDYYHLNFGWGGSSNGWYLLPDEIPYELTVIEGVIVDIVPNVVFADGFEDGNNTRWSGGARLR